MSRFLTSAALLIFFSLFTGAARAEEVVLEISAKPKPKHSALKLFLEGAAMAIPDYFLGVTMHEGSHALTVMMLGGNVTHFSVLPKMFNGHIRFGETGWQGTFTREEHTMVSMAPKATDLLVMGTYTALLETGAWPKSKPLQVMLVVLATGAWVDFSKDLFSKNPDNDTIKVFNSYGLESESQRLPWRMLWGAASLGGAIEIGRGLYKVFKHEDADEEGSTENVQLTKYGEPVISPHYVGWKVNW